MTVVLRISTVLLAALSAGVGFGSCVYYARVLNGELRLMLWWVGSASSVCLITAISGAGKVYAHATFTWRDISAPLLMANILALLLVTARSRSRGVRVPPAQ